MNYVTIGGGTGQESLLTGLKELTTGEDSITAIVTATDTGGGTGYLRSVRGTPGCVGDARRVINALARNRGLAAAMGQMAPTSLGGSHGVTVGHLQIVDHAQGSIQSGIFYYSNMVNVPSTCYVLAVTEATVDLAVHREDGSVQTGEHLLDDVSRVLPRITRAELRGAAIQNGTAVLNPRVQEALRRADVIVVGPGDLYGSLVPNFLVPDMVEAMRKTKAFVFLVLPLMTKCTDTWGLTGKEYLSILEQYLGRSVDVIVGNNARPPPEVLEYYRAQFSEPLEIQSLCHDRRLVAKDLLTVEEGTSRIRHRSANLAALIWLYPELRR